MRRSTRILLGACGVIALAWVGAALVLTARSRHECSIGASTTGCETVDYVLIYGTYLALPGLTLMLAVLLILNWKPRRRSRR